MKGFFAALFLYVLVESNSLDKGTTELFKIII